MKKIIQGRSLPFFGFFLCPFFTFLLTESYCYNPFTDMKPVVWALNLVFYWGVAALLFVLTGRLRAALRMQTAMFMLTGLANYYVISFRSSPILPWDIYSAGTAASAADNFSYALSARAWLVLLGFAALLLAEQLFCCRVERKRLRMAGGLAAALLLSGMTLLLHQEEVISGLRLYDKMFTPGVVQKRNGSAVAFLMELKYVHAEKPDGYDAQACRKLLEAYGEGDETEAGGSVLPSEKPPHIIVIMNESFADMSWIGELPCNKDYMPYFHSLQRAENTVSGKLHVSVLGGNTANTEFEFLTGNTMAFLPQGSIPYQQHIRGALPSLASELKERGYFCVAMHPYHAKGWSRQQVYPFMGFDEMHFLPDYANADYVRKYVSDASDFAQIIETYENRRPDQPLFLFNVTMQNHGGYDQEFANFTPQIKVEGIASTSLSQYLSLIFLTDQALKELIAYFSAQEEEILVLFFGDHQPNDTVAAPVLKNNKTTVRELTPEQEMKRYEVPFVLWANFDIKEERDREMSANFLALEVLRQAGIPLQGYYGYLETLQQRYPVISGKQILDESGRRLTDEERKESQELLTYQRLQYYRLFDAGRS